MKFNELEDGKPLYEAYSKKVAEMAKHYDNPNTEDVHIELKGFSEILMTVAKMYDNEMTSDDEFSEAFKVLAGEVGIAVDMLDEIMAERPDEITSENIKILEELRMMRLKSYI